MSNLDGSFAGALAASYNPAPVEAPPPTPFIPLSAVESDPRFAKLSFEDQIAARQRWAADQLPNDPQFQQLTPEAQAKVFNTLTSERMPVLEPTNGEPTDYLMNSWMNNANKAKQGDAEAMNNIANSAFEERLIQNSGALGWLSTKVKGLISDVTLGHDIYQTTSETDQANRTKAWKYLESTLAANPDAYGLARTLIEKGAGYAGVAFDIAATHGLLKGVTAGLGALTAGTSVGRALDTVSQFSNTLERAKLLQGTDLSMTGKFLLGRVLPLASGVALDSTAMTATHFLDQATVQSIYGDVIPPEEQANFATIFGQNVVGDLMGRALFRTAQTLFKGVKLMTSSLAKPGESPGSAEDLIQKVVTGQDIPDEVLRTYPPEAREAFYQLRRQPWVDKLFGGNGAELQPGSPEFITAHTYKNGIILDPVGDKIIAKDLNGDWTGTPQKVIGTFSNYDDAFTGTLKFVHSKELTEAIPKGAPLNDDSLVIIKQKATSKLESVDGVPPQQAHLDATNIAQNLIPDATGKIPRDTIAKVSNALDPNVTTLMEVPEDDFIRLASKGQAIVETDGSKTLFYPSTLTKPGTLGAFTDALLKTKAADSDLTTLQGGFGDTVKSAQDAAGNKYSFTWLSKNAEALGYNLKTEDNGITTLIKGTETKTFDSPMSASVNVMRDMGAINDDYLKKYYTNELGLVVSPKKAAQGATRLEIWSKAAGKNGPGLIASGDSWEQIWQSHPDLLPKLPIESSPTMRIMSDGGLEVSGKVASGSWKTIQNLDKNFFDSANNLTDKVLKREFNGRQLTHSPSTNIWEVTIPELNYKGSFDTMEEAQSFISTGFRRLEDIQHLGAWKGVDISYNKGQLYARTPTNPEPVLLQNLDEASAFVKNSPTPLSSAPEFTDMPFALKDIIKDPEMKEILQAAVPKSTVPIVSDAQLTRVIKARKNPGKPTIGTYGGIVYGGTAGMVRKMSHELNDPELYEKGYLPIAEGNAKYRGRAQTIDFAIQKTLRGISGKDRAMLKNFLETPQEKWVDLEKTLNMKLSPTHVKALAELRSILDAHRKIFGIDPYTAIADYLPRVREALKYDLANGEPPLGTENASQWIAKRLYGGSVDRIPDSLRFFAENLRTRDLAEYVESTQVDEIVARYIHRGYKKMFMDGAITNAKDKVKSLFESGKLIGARYGSMVSFLETASGMFATQDEEIIKAATDDMTRTFHQKLVKFKLAKPGAENSLHYQDLATSLKKYVVAATMAARPGLVARNLMQIFGTTANIIGTEWVQSAINAIGKKGMWNTLNKVYEEARATGHLMGTITPLGDLPSGKGFIDRFNQAGMKPYMDSDYATRMISDTAVELRWQKPAAKFASSDGSDMATKQFLRDSGIRMLPAADQVAIMKRMQEAGPNAAKELFQQRLQDYALFSYQKYDNPLSTKGFFGKIWGMFAHYPMQYASMVKEVFTSGDMDKKLTFLLNAIGTTAAFAIGNKALGLDPKQFMPWNQMVFTGGPYYEMMGNFFDTINSTMQIVNGTKEPQLKAAAAKKAALSIIGTTLPGGLYIKTALSDKLSEALQQGDSYEAMALILGLPYVGWTHK